MNKNFSLFGFSNYNFLIHQLNLRLKVWHVPNLYRAPQAPLPSLSTTSTQNYDPEHTVRKFNQSISDSIQYQR